MPSNQKQIIEQNKCTYSPLGKAFSKQKKTKKMEDKGEKQIKAIQNQGEIKTIKKNMLIVIKIIHWSQSQKKYLINL